jgi:gamma-glutamyl-gamma-aminobutyrate hydrolase PuuD
MKYYLPKGPWPLDAAYSKFMNRLSYILVESAQEADFLLLPGGIDIGLNESRDSQETDSYKQFIDADKPVIGICRGMQFVLVSSGAKIISHIPDVLNEMTHTTITGHWTGESSWHKTTSGLYTNSRHHQGFLAAPENWEVIDKTEDGIIEAVECGKQFGVQWHPELTEMNGTPAQDWFIFKMEQILKK